MVKLYISQDNEYYSTHGKCTYDCTQGLVPYCTRLCCEILIPSRRCLWDSCTDSTFELRCIIDTVELLQNTVPANRSSITMGFATYVESYGWNNSLI